MSQVHRVKSSENRPWRPSGLSQERKNELARIRNAEKRKNGLCLHCKAPAHGSYCDRCRERNNVVKKKYRDAHAEQLRQYQKERRIAAGSRNRRPPRPSDEVLEKLGNPYLTDKEEAMAYHRSQRGIRCGKCGVTFKVLDDVRPHDRLLLHGLCLNILRLGIA